MAASRPKTLPLSNFSCTISAMMAQIVLCGLVWVFAIIMMVQGGIVLPDIVAAWVVNNPSDTNMAVNVISTLLAIFGSYLLGVVARHALTFRLPRGIHLPVVSVWIQLATNSLFFQPRRYLLWTLVAALWIAVTHYLTPAWSNMLIPVPVALSSSATTREFDFLSPAFANYAQDHLSFPFVPPTARNYSLNPSEFGFLGNSTGYFYQAGTSAVSDYLQPGYPAFVSQFNSTTGGANPTSAQNQLDFSALKPNFQGLSTSYTLTQQGYTADISCKRSSSPSINLTYSGSAQHTFQTPWTSYSYALDTWSWSTNCSGNGEYYSGEATILTNNGTLNGNGLFATSVCFYQDFSGPSNQSFLVLMQSPAGSGYSQFYFSANPSLPIVCQVTPLVTTLQVQYNQTGLANVTEVLDQRLLPDDSWILASVPGVVIWSSYLLAQGPYSNAFADGLLQTVALANATLLRGDITPVVEQYLRGIFEYMGSVMRATLMSRYWQQAPGQALPVNMSVVLSGTMSTRTIGWKIHPRTHIFALGAITLVTVVTVALGIHALLEASRYNAAHGPPHWRLTDATFNPTNLVEFLVAASMGNMTHALSEPKSDEDRDNLVVELDMTTKGHTLLNIHHDPIETTAHAEPV